MTDADVEKGGHMTMYPGFTVTARPIDEKMAVVELQGEMDVYTTPRAKDLVTQLLSQGFCHLIFDMRHMEYIDSTGLGLLIGTLRRLREEGGSLRLVAPHSRVRRLLEVARLTYSFTIEHSQQDAIASLRAESSL